MVIFHMAQRSINWLLEGLHLCNIKSCVLCIKTDILDKLASTVCPLPHLNGQSVYQSESNFPAGDFLELWIPACTCGSACYTVEFFNLLNAIVFPCSIGQYLFLRFDCQLTGSIASRQHSVDLLRQVLDRIYCDSCSTGHQPVLAAWSTWATTVRSCTNRGTGTRVWWLLGTQLHILRHWYCSHWWVQWTRRVAAQVWILWRKPIGSFRT